MPHPKFQMLQDDAAAEAPAAADAGGDVVFPDDYPNSVKHFLMLGAIGFLIGAIVFLTLNFMRVRRSLAHSVSTGTGAQAQPQPHRYTDTQTHRHTGTQAQAQARGRWKRVLVSKAVERGKLADPSATSQRSPGQIQTPVLKRVNPEP
jgi:hypothetical protein